VGNQSTLTGLALLDQVHLEVATTFELSPLPAADAMTGLFGALTAGGFRLALSGQIMAPLEQADGFSIEADAVLAFNEERPERKVLLRTGLAYLQQQNRHGGRYANFGVAVSLLVPVYFPYLGFELETQVNLLQLKRWVSPEAQDPWFFTPLGAGFVVTLGDRLFLKAMAVHYLGSQDGTTVHFKAALGVLL
jgi:hypothetical protein